MTETLGMDAWPPMFARAAELVRENRDHLSRLDSAGGDGDHGPTMTRALELAVKAVDASKAEKPADLLNEVAWAVMGVDGGATGPLFGSLFMGMASGAGDAVDLDGPALAKAFEEGLAMLLKQTRARIGDKTLVDALDPAVKALSEATAAGEGPARALEIAFEAATAGAEATRNLSARFGRAKNVGERSLGTEDPGAVSVSLVFKGFSEGARQRG